MVALLHASSWLGTSVSALWLTVAAPGSTTQEPRLCVAGLCIWFRSLRFELFGSRPLQAAFTSRVLARRPLPPLTTSGLSLPASWSSALLSVGACPSS